MTTADAAGWLEQFFAALQRIGEPVVTTAELVDVVEDDEPSVVRNLEALVRADHIGTRRLPTGERIWFPVEWTAGLEREHVVCFPDERIIVVENPEQYTRALLSQFAHLEATTGDGAYRYRIRPVDVWHAPYEEFEQLEGAVVRVIGDLDEGLASWLADQWQRARRFRLITHPDGYTVLEAVTPELMGNVARQVLDEEHLHGPISDTESWVVEGSEAAIKRSLYEEGFPVQDDRDLDTGEPLAFETELTLREYQTRWVDTFMEAGAGVIVGPPGSGKTITAVEIMQRVGGETLVLVPSRELAAQWRDVILSQTTLGQDQIGEYHGGTKQLRPVTIATYHIASMGRHRHLFDDREWGLIVTDEVQHIPADVYRGAATLQSRFRLGLSASPVREDDKEAEIFTLIGPPIGTDWSALLEAGYVLEPELEIRYVPWTSTTDRESYDLAEGHQRRQLAGMNPAKRDEIERLLDAHPDDPVLIFVDWLDQGREYADVLGVPFISGETRHAERERLFEAFRNGDERVLVISRVGDEGLDLPDASVAILASGLGGSRRQGTQRVGRTMRPAASASVYVLATRGSVEEDFARNQLRHLQGKGMKVSETTVAGGEE